MTKKEKAQRKETMWNIINSLLAGAISFFSALIAAGEFNWKIVMISLITALLIALTKFKTWHDGEKKEYSQVFRFL